MVDSLNSYILKNSNTRTAHFQRVLSSVLISVLVSFPIYIIQVDRSLSNKVRGEIWLRLEHFCFLKNVFRLTVIALVILPMVNHVYVLQAVQISVCINEKNVKFCLLMFLR